MPKMFADRVGGFVCLFGFCFFSGNSVVDYNEREERLNSFEAEN